MRASKIYQRYAARCLEEARNTIDPDKRTFSLKWRKSGRCLLRRQVLRAIRLTLPMWKIEAIDAPDLAYSVQTPGQRRAAGAGKCPYFSWLEMLLNVPFNFVPSPFTTAITAIEMPAAIRPYSIAVAPD